MDSPNTLHFDDLVKSYVEGNPRFLRRQWLAHTVQNWLEDETQPFLLLTAEPGFGKTTFMAQLAHDNPTWLRYYIRRDQTSGFSNVGARQFLLRLGFQLAALYPQLMLEEAVVAANEQEVHHVGRGGNVLGIAIEDLHKSPFFRQILLKTGQSTEQLDGEAIAVQIDRLITEPLLLPLSELQDLALFAPARRWQAQSQEQPLVVLLDALDELRYVDAQEDILYWLSNCEVADMPSNIRFVLSSRPPTERLNYFIQVQTKHLTQLDQKQALDVQQIHGDTQFYAENHFLTHNMLIDYWQDVGEEPADWVEEVVEKANGNLGYLDIIARTLDQTVNRQAIEALLTLETLPSALEGLYEFFLSQIQLVAMQQPIYLNGGQNGDFVRAWSVVFQRLLGVLAVAQEPLTKMQMTILGNIQAGLSHRSQALEQSLAPFLRQQNGRFSLYHTTLADFLQDPALEASRESAGLYAQPQLWHRRISQHFLQFAGRWSDCEDPYCFYYLPTHLAKGGDNEGLAELLFNFAWLEAKLEQTTVTHIINDFGLLETETAVLVKDALQLSAHILAEDKHQLAPQLVGRLKREPHLPIKQLVAAAEAWEGGGQAWLRPLQATLTPPSSPLRSTLSGHHGAVNAVAYIPDKKQQRVISASDDGTLKIWDVETGMAEVTLTGHEGAVTAVAVTPDGQTAVSTAADKTLRVWSIAQQALLQTHKIQEELAQPFTTDGHYILAFSKEKRFGYNSWQPYLGKTIKRWRLDDGQEDVIQPAIKRRYRLLIHLTGFALAFWLFAWGLEIGLADLHPVSLIFLGMISGVFYAVLWLIFYVKMATYYLGNNKIHSAGFAAAGARAVLLSRNRTVRLWDLAAGKRLATIPNLSTYRRLTRGLFPLRKVVGGEQYVRKTSWFTAENEPENQFDSKLNLQAVALATGGTHIVASPFTKTIKVWELVPKSGPHLRARAVTTFAAHDKQVSVIKLLPDDRHVISAAGNVIKVWNLVDGQELCTLLNHHDPIRDIAVLPDGKTAVSAAADRTLKVWDLTKGSLIDSSIVALGEAGETAVSLVLPPPETKVEPERQLEAVSALTVASDGQTAYVAFDDSDSAQMQHLEVWDLTTGEASRASKLETKADSLAIAADTQRVVSGYSKGLKLWNLTGKRTTSLRLWDWTRWKKGYRNKWQLLFLIAGPILISISTPPLAWLLLIAIPVYLLTVSGDNSIRTLALTADGEWAVAGLFNTLKIKNVNPHWRQRLRHSWRRRTLGRHKDEITTLALSLNGQRAVSCAMDNQLKVWDLGRRRRVGKSLEVVDPNLAVALTPDGEQVVYAHYNEVRVWTAAEGRDAVTRLAGHAGLITAVSVSPDGQQVLAASDDNKLIIWELASGQQLSTFDGDIPFVKLAMTKNGRVVAVDEAQQVHVLHYEGTV